jgi:thiamine kinase-like enzyme
LIAAVLAEIADKSVHRAKIGAVDQLPADALLSNEAGPMQVLEMKGQRGRYEADSFANRAGGKIYVPYYVIHADFDLRAVAYGRLDPRRIRLRIRIKQLCWRSAPMRRTIAEAGICTPEARVNDSERYVGPLVNPFWRSGQDGNEFAGAPPIPRSAAEITPQLLSEIVHRMHPEVTIAAVEVLDAKTFGDDPDVISSANRVKLTVRYSGDTPNAGSLPTALLLKVARNDVKIGPIYANETRVYTRLSKEVGIETPLALGGAYDSESQRYALVLGDLIAAGARFPSVREAVSDLHISSLLDMLAKLHARYWQSPRFQSDLSWVEDHVGSPLADFMEHISSVYNVVEAESEAFKRELLQSIGAAPAWLARASKAVQRHQATLPHTLCHGDAHIGNTFIHADGRVGLCDWQLTARGHYMHDVHYMIITSLSVEARRRKERDLLAYYLDRLHHYGVSEPPSFQSAWTEYRRAIVWGLWVGWVGTPVLCYGWEITLMNHIRLVTAYQDLETGKLAAALL